MKKLNAEQLKEHIKKNGITLVKLIGDDYENGAHRSYSAIGKEFWVGLDYNGEVSGYDEYTDNKNQELDFNCDYCWDLEGFAKFELVEEPKQLSEVPDDTIAQQIIEHLENGKAVVVRCKSGRYMYFYPEEYKGYPYKGDYYGGITGQNKENIEKETLYEEIIETLDYPVRKLQGKSADMIVLDEATSETPNNLIIHCPTKEDYIKIVDKIGWWERNSEINRKNYWNSYKNQTTLTIENNEITGYSNLEYDKIHSLDYTFTTAKEFLGEEGNMGSPCKYPSYNKVMQWEKISEKPFTINLNNNRKETKKMSIVQKLKQLAKSKEQKRIDKYLKDEIGFTNEGMQLIAETLMEDKDFAQKIDVKLAKIEKSEEKKKLLFDTLGLIAL